LVAYSLSLPASAAVPVGLSQRSGTDAATAFTLAAAVSLATPLFVAVLVKPAPFSADPVCTSCENPSPDSGVPGGIGTRTSGGSGGTGASATSAASSTPCNSPYANCSIALLLRSS
jgi:hypothetical protein